MQGRTGPEPDDLSLPILVPRTALLRVYRVFEVMLGKLGEISLAGGEGGDRDVVFLLELADQGDDVGRLGFEDFGQGAEADCRVGAEEEEEVWELGG